MEKTLKQIADELGIDKQRVYRFVKKNHITASSEVMQTKYYDDVAERLIKTHFNNITTSNERSGEAHQKHINDTVIDTLLKQLEEKDKQIEQLLKALDQAQHLQAAAESRVAQLEAPSERPADREKVYPGKPTLEEFKEMVYEDRENRKLKNRIKRFIKR